MKTFDEKLGRVIIKLVYTLDDKQHQAAYQILAEIEGREIELFGEHISEKKLRKKLQQLINQRYLQNKNLSA